MTSAMALFHKYHLIEDCCVEDTNNSGLRVIKRDGTTAVFDAEKISLAITKAFLAVEGRENSFLGHFNSIYNNLLGILSSKKITYMFVHKVCTNSRLLFPKFRLSNELNIFNYQKLVNYKIDNLTEYFVFSRFFRLIPRPQGRENLFKREYLPCPKNMMFLLVPNLI